MHNPSALAQLRDIHLPDPIDWWPFAPGWYVLAAICFILVGITVWYGYKLYQLSLPKKQALSLLKVYKEQYEKDHDAQLLSARVSELLKRVSLIYYPRMEVASMHGEEWFAFLNRTAKGMDFQAVKSHLLESPFKSSEKLQMQPLIIRAEKWIRQRGIRCLK